MSTLGGVGSVRHAGRLVPLLQTPFRGTEPGRPLDGLKPTDHALRLPPLAAYKQPNPLMAEHDKIGIRLVVSDDVAASKDQSPHLIVLGLSF